jgi:hypothetical protein
MTAIETAPQAAPRVPTRAAPANPLIGMAVGITEEHKKDLEDEIVATEAYLTRLRNIGNMFGADPYPDGQPGNQTALPAAQPVVETIKSAGVTEVDPPTIEAEPEEEEEEEEEKPKARNPRAEYRGRKPGRKPLPRDENGNIIRPEKPASTAPVIPPPSTRVEIDDDDDDDLDDQVPPPRDRKAEASTVVKRKEENNRLPPQAQARLDEADGKAPDPETELRKEIAKYIWRRGMATGGDISKDVPGVHEKNFNRMMVHPWFEVGDKINKRWSLTIKGKNEALEGY